MAVGHLLVEWGEVGTSQPAGPDPVRCGVRCPVCVETVVGPFHHFSVEGLGRQQHSFCMKLIVDFGHDPRECLYTSSSLISLRIALHYQYILFSGVYENLQKGCDVDCSDVEKSINLVCEETTPVELEITPFLQSICGHLHQQMKLALQPGDIPPYGKT